MTAYVLGFIYDESLEQVLLQQKNRSWQKGRLNGIGGKIRDDEDSYDAIRREAREELTSTAGFDMGEIHWLAGPKLIFREVVVYVFFADLRYEYFMSLIEPDEPGDSGEPEEVTRKHLDSLPSDRLLVEHVAWLVHLGPELLKVNRPQLSIRYGDYS